MAKFLGACQRQALIVVLIVVSVLLNAQLLVLFLQQHQQQQEEEATAEQHHLLHHDHQSRSSTFSPRRRQNGSLSSPPTPSSSLKSPLLQLLIPEMADLQVWDRLLLAWKDENGTEIPNVGEEFDVKRIQDGYSCPYTAQYQLVVQEKDKSDDWLLISLDKNGIRKTIGGDEMYVLYYHHDNNNNNQMTATAAVAYSIDQGDGSYLLKFHWTPYYSTTISEGISDTSNNSFGSGGGGQLVIHLQYTCGLGTLHHPKKKLWRTGGYLMRTYRRQVPIAPSNIRPFIPPNANGAIDLDQYFKVFMFGDSNLHGHYMSTQNWRIHQNLHFIRKPDSALYWKSMKRKFLPKIEWFVNLSMNEYEQEQQQQYQLPSSFNETYHGRRRRRYALILGSACWDIVSPAQSGPEFRDHLRSMKYMLIELKKTFDPIVVDVDIYWHSGLALHLHVAGEEQGWETRTPLKYMSYSRSFDLYEKQKQILKELMVVGGNEVQLLDLMHASYLSADHYMKGDARHADASLSRKLFFYYYPKKKPPPD